MQHGRWGNMHGCNQSKLRNLYYSFIFQRKKTAAYPIRDVGLGSPYPYFDRTLAAETSHHRDGDNGWWMIWMEIVRILRHGGKSFQGPPKAPQALLLCVMISHPFVGHTN